MATTPLLRTLLLSTLLTGTALATTTAATPTPTPATTKTTTSTTKVTTTTKAPVASPAATNASMASTKTAEAMLTKLTKNQVDIVQSFPSIGNLQGFVVKAKGDQGTPSIVYVDTQGRYAVVGALLTADGANQSEVDAQKYINASVAKAALADSPSTAWILDGKADAKHSMYVVADPNCIYCHKLYQMTRSAVQSGDLVIRWIWVGFLKDSSAGIAKAIIAAPDPLVAMAQNENGFNEATETGGLAPIANPSDAVNKKFQQNMAFINKYQFPGTPVLIYQDGQGNPMSRYGVSPDDLPAMINTMGTLPQ